MAIDEQFKNGVHSSYLTAHKAVEKFVQAAHAQVGTTEGSVKTFFENYRKATLQDVIGGDYSSAVKGEVNLIQMRALYEGVARSIMLEDERPTGSTKMYGIVAAQGGLDPLPALQIKSTVGSSPQFVTAGDMVYPELSRLAVTTQIPLKTIATMPENVVPVWEEMAVRGIVMQEDMMLWQLLEAGISEYATVTGDNSHTITSANGQLTWAIVNQAIYTMRSQALTPYALICNQTALQWIQQWDSFTSSVWLKNELTEQPMSDRLQLPSGLTIIASITMPQDVAYLVPVPLQMGFMPTVWGITANEDPKGLSNYMYTTDYSELVGFVLANPRAPFKINLNASQTDSTAIAINSWKKTKKADKVAK